MNIIIEYQVPYIEDNMQIEVNSLLHSDHNSVRMEG